MQSHDDKPGAPAATPFPTGQTVPLPAMAPNTAGPAPVQHQPAVPEFQPVAMEHMRGEPVNGPNGQQPAAEPAPAWPMEIDKFLAGDFLNRADVVLLTEVGSMKGWLIRWAIRSHFTHAALVFLVPKRHLGMNNHYLIESGTSGVDISIFDHIVKGKKHPNLVAIKRFEPEWFSTDMCRMVSGNMLKFIKSDYDFSKAGMIGVKFRAWGWKLRNSIFGKPPKLEKYFKRGRYVPAEFICSGFVQYGFISTVQKLAQVGILKDVALEHVLFGDKLNPNSDVEEMLAVTPGDISHCDKLAWKFIIYNGLVYPVSSKAEAFDLIHQLI